VAIRARGRLIREAELFPGKSSQVKKMCSDSSIQAIALLLQRGLMRSRAPVTGQDRSARDQSGKHSHNRNQPFFAGLNSFRKSKSFFSRISPDSFEDELEDDLVADFGVGLVERSAAMCLCGASRLSLRGTRLSIGH